jgi:hypothetical protein
MTYPDPRKFVSEVQNLKEPGLDQFLRPTKRRSGNDGKFLIVKNGFSDKNRNLSRH